MNARLLASSYLNRQFACATGHRPQPHKHRECTLAGAAGLDRRRPFHGRRWIRRRGGGGRRPRARLRRRRDVLRGGDQPHGRLLRPHLRLRHWRLRRCDANGVVPDEVLPGGVEPDEERPARHLLQIRRPAAHGLHLVVVHRRDALVAGGEPRDEDGRPPGHHAYRRHAVPRRLGDQRRRRQHRHAHHRPDAARLRSWVHLTGCSFVPRRDIAGTVARRVHHGVQHLPRVGVTGRHRHQLLHQPHPRVGLARVARPRRRPRRHRRPGRPARPRHSQQPGPARRDRQGPRLAEAPPWSGRGHRGGVQGHRPGRGGRAAERRGRVREAAWQGVPALPCDGGGHPLVLRPHRRDRHGRLLAGAVPDGRVQQPEGHPWVRDPQPREPGLVVPVLRRHGPRRPQVPVPHRRRSHDHLPGTDGMDPSGPSREARRGDDAARLRAGRAVAHVPVHVQLRHVVGPAQVGGPQRDLPRGGPVGRAGPDGVHRALPLLRADAGVRLPALRHGVRHLSVLRRMGPGDDGIRGGVPAGDQGRAAGGHALRLGAPLVLAEVRWGRQAGGSGELPVGGRDAAIKNNVTRNRG